MAFDNLVGSGPTFRKTWLMIKILASTLAESK